MFAVPWQRRCVSNAVILTLHQTHKIQPAVLHSTTRCHKAWCLWMQKWHSNLLNCLAIFLIIQIIKRVFFPWASTSWSSPIHDWSMQCFCWMMSLSGAVKVEPGPTFLPHRVVSFCRSPLWSLMLAAVNAIPHRWMERVAFFPHLWNAVWMQLEVRSSCTVIRSEESHVKLHRREASQFSLWENLLQFLHIVFFYIW